MKALETWRQAGLPELRRYDGISSGHGQTEPAQQIGCLMF